MHEDDSGVAMSRWLCHATPGTIARTTAAVRGFACVHGMPAQVPRRMTAAVTEALVEVFDAETELVGTRDGTVVDAATDGVCLTVRLQGPGRWPADSTCGRLGTLADRVELSFDEHGGSMTVLLEFPSEGGAHGPRAGGLRGGFPSRAARRCSRSPSGLRRRADTMRRARRRPRPPARP